MGHFPVRKLLDYQRVPIKSGLSSLALFNCQRVGPIFRQLKDRKTHLGPVDLFGMGKMFGCHLLEAQPEVVVYVLGIGICLKSFISYE